MKIQNVYDLVFKAIGIFIFLNTIENLKNIIPFLFIPNSIDFNSNSNTSIGILISMSYYIIVFFIAYQFVFNTHKILDKLPSKIFIQDKEIGLSGTSQSIFRVILISIGIYFGISELPMLLTGTVKQIINVQNDYKDINFDNYYLWIALIRLILAFLLILKSKNISSYLLKNGDDDQSKIKEADQN